MNTKEKEEIWKEYFDKLLNTEEPRELIEKRNKDISEVEVVISGQLPWDPSVTHFPIPEVIMDNIVCTAVTHVEFYSNFINSDLPLVTDSLLDLLFHRLSCHANWSPTLVFITDVLSSVLKTFHLFIHSPLTQTTVFILNLHSPVYFRRFHTL